MFQNTNTTLIAAMRKHAATRAVKGVVPVDTEDAKRLCDVGEVAMKGNPVALALIESTRSHAELQKGVMPLDAVSLLQLCDYAAIAIKTDPALDTKGCELPHQA